MSEAFSVTAAKGRMEELRLEANGLRVLLVHEPDVPVVAVCVVYHVGSRNEAVGHTGSTHLLEHLMFKGSRAFDPAEGRGAARVLERVGASFNATTWLDRTNYYETLPAEHVDLALALEADRMRFALLRDEDLRSEMTVVRNEFERGENDPFDVLLKESFAVAFREHPYHHPTIGWRSDIENVTIDRLRGFYDTFYYPDNATLVLVGSFDRDEALARVAHHFSPLPAAPRPVPAVITEEPPQQGERRFVIRRSGEVGWVVTSWRTPAATHGDTHALAVLADGLASGVTSRLYQRLVETGRCLDVQAVAWQLRDPGLFQVFASLNGDATHDAVERAIREELEGIARDGLTADELERAKVQVEAQTAYHRDSPAQVAAALTEAISCADWRFYLDYPEKIRAVSGDDIVEVARRTFHEDSMSVGTFVPRKGGGARGAAAPPQPGLRPRPCGWRSTVAAGVRETRLASGAEVLVLPRHRNPTVHIHGSLLAGFGMRSMDTWTAASFLPDMLERGAGTYSRWDLARAIEDRGIELDISGESFNPHEVFFSGRCLSRHLPLVLELLAAMLRTPALAEEEVGKLRQLRLGEILQAREDTFVRAFEAFSRHVFPPGHPHYRRPWEERRHDLEVLRREDLLEAHARLYGPASLVMAVVGDCEAETVVTALDGLFAGWDGSASAVPEVARLSAAAVEPGEVLDPMPEKPSLDVVMGHPGGLRRRDPDFLGAMLGNAVLGQSTLSSRLGRRLRDTEGLTYGVVSRFMGASLVDGPWITTFSVAPANRARAVEAAREEIARLVAEGPTEEEVADERAAMAGSYRVALATPAGVARELARLRRHGLPPGEIDRLPEAVLATGAGEVAQALRRHLDPDRLVVAVAGELE